MLLAAGLPGCAADPLPPTVCARPDVLARVGEILQRQGRTIVLDLPAGQVGPPAPPATPLARCAVRAHTLGLDTNRYGQAAVYEPFTVGYSVELRARGLFVSVD